MTTGYKDLYAGRRGKLPVPEGEEALFVLTKQGKCGSDARTTKEKQKRVESFDKKLCQFYCNL
jgi:hypothetical protein